MPGSFCAGADLIEWHTMSQMQVSKFLINLHAALGTLENLPVPTITTIDGPALGDGLELTLTCDLHVAGSSVTKLGLPETKLSIIPGLGRMQCAMQLLGLFKVKNLIFMVHMLTVHKVCEWGN